MSKSTLKILPALIVAITALVAQPVFGGAITPHEIIITENSSTDLTVTYDGLTTGITVNNQNSNQWFVTFPITIFFRGLAVDWVEPENPALGNAVNFQSNSLTVFSDASTNFSPVSDGTTVNNVGTDGSNGGSINATFFDKGDVAAVPDTGTTFSLFGLSLMGLGFLRRKLC